jgi:1,4-dihydroxy-2-naphthoate polyprenyltransferase
MGINVAMWRKATAQLIKIDKKSEWDALDVVSKWLIATRSAVTTVTLYSCVIAGLFALRAGSRDWLAWIVMTIGLFLAHGANNLLNDYTDFRRGVDTDNYFRTQYGVHPLAQGFWSKPVQMRWFVVTGLLGLAAAVFAIVRSSFDPVVIGIFVYGSLMLLLYTWPLKHFAVGELTIFLIWGPVMIGGVYLVLAHGWSWNVALAAVPFGLSTMTINMGKHTDKSGEDRAKGIHTLPVLIGQTAARWMTITAIVLAYAVTVYVVAVPRFLSPAMVLVFLASGRAAKAIRRLAQPRPAEAPAGYPIWPRWFSTVCFMHNRRFGNLFILGIVADTVLRLLLPGFWQPLA